MVLARQNCALVPPGKLDGTEAPRWPSMIRTAPGVLLVASSVVGCASGVSGFSVGNRVVLVQKGLVFLKVDLTFFHPSGFDDSWQQVGRCGWKHAQSSFTFRRQSYRKP